MSTTMQFIWKRTRDLHKCLKESAIFLIFLSLLPHCSVVSIAYLNPSIRFLGKKYNNSRLKVDQVGSKVHLERRLRFTQLIGDSHKLKVTSFLKQHGSFDLVFIDGDHSRIGVKQDTEFALQIINHSGVICWHDANPRPKYQDVKLYLENELTLKAIATPNTYIGGISCWCRKFDSRLD